MQTIHTFDELRIPAYALCYLVNADDSGLELDDKQAIDDYMSEFYTLAEKENAHVIFSTMEAEFEEYFTGYPAFGLACNVVDCIILIVK